MLVVALAVAALRWSPVLGPRAVAGLAGLGESASADTGSSPVPHTEAAAARGGQLGGPTLPGRPQRLDIASLGLHAAVVPIALSAATLTPPSDPREVGWWRDGARAGAPAGTVVITGHTVHTGGGAMDNLGQVNPGDRVVLTVRGAPIDYRVVRVRVLSKAAVAEEAARLFPQDGPPRLVLVTCGGWNGHDYESNVVVTATPSAKG